VHHLNHIPALGIGSYLVPLVSYRTVRGRTLLAREFEVGEATIWRALNG